MDKPKFYAKTEFEVQKNPDQSGQLINLPEINISNFSCQQLLVNLQNNINKPRPSSVLFKWLDNKKAQLDIEHQRSVISQIHNLRDMQHEAVNLQAESVFSNEMVNMLVAGMRAEAEILAKNNALRLLLYVTSEIS